MHRRHRREAKNTIETKKAVRFRPDRAINSLASFVRSIYLLMLNQEVLQNAIIDSTW